MPIEYIALEWPDAELAGWTGPGWYFWTEDQATCIGPYKSKEEAEVDAKDYGDRL